MRKLIRLFIAELNAWVTHVLRWFPGSSGFCLRSCYYRRRLAACGQKVNIPEGCYIRDCRNIAFGTGVTLGVSCQIYADGKGTERIRIGDDVRLNSNVMINADCEGYIEIGDCCILGPNVVLRTSNHIFSDRQKPIIDQGHKPGSIIIKDNVWIGANVTVSGDVTIGAGAVIGAGSVVIKNVADYKIAAGVPARTIGER